MVCLCFCFVLFLDTQKKLLKKWKKKFFSISFIQILYFGNESTQSFHISQFWIIQHLIRLFIINKINVCVCVRFVCVCARDSSITMIQFSLWIIININITNESNQIKSKQKISQSPIVGIVFYYICNVSNLVYIFIIITHIRTDNWKKNVTRPEMNTNKSPFFYPNAKKKFVTKENWNIKMPRHIYTLEWTHTLWDTLQSHTHTQW